MKDIAFKREIHVTRYQAATRQIEAAVDAFESGNFDIAVTLACAAEEMAPQKDSGLFKLLMNSTRWGSLPQKRRAEKVNFTRNWLKHRNEEQPDELLIHEAEAAYCIVRALSVWEPWTPKIQTFAHKFMEAIGAPNKPTKV